VKSTTSTLLPTPKYRSGLPTLSLDMKKIEETLPPFLVWLNSKERERHSWEVKYEEIELGDLIGKGAYGEVYKVLVSFIHSFIRLL
jgi:hypothetical protein